MTDLKIAIDQNSTRSRNNERDIKMIHSSIKDVACDVKELKENHLEHLKKDLQDFKLDVTSRLDRMEVTQKWYFRVGGTTIALAATFGDRILDFLTKTH